jgi:hypothetical protein
LIAWLASRTIVVMHTLITAGLVLHHIDDRAREAAGARRAAEVRRARDQSPGVRTLLPAPIPRFRRA